MRVLFVHNSYQQRGGEDVAFENEAELFRNRGHDVFTAQASNDSIQGFAASLKTALRLTDSGWGFQWMHKKIEKYRPHRIHVHNFFPLLSPSIFRACSEKSIPVTLTLHNFRLTCANGLLLRNDKPCEICIKGSAYSAVLYKCYRGSLFGSLAVARMIENLRSDSEWHKGIDSIITLNDFSYKKMIEAGLPLGKLMVVPNFIPNARIQKYATGPRKKNQSARILFVGRLSEEKGIRTLLDAAKKSSYQFRIIGGGPCSDDVSKAAKENPSSVEYLGSQPASVVMDEIVQADVLLVPSLWYENLPTVIIEAFACGTPVLVAGHGGMASMVQDGATGRHFQPGDVRDLLLKLHEMLSDSTRWEQMSKKSKQEFSEKYSEELHYDQLLKVYKCVDSIQP